MSAIQARTHLSCGSIDVVVLLFLRDGESAADFRYVCDREGIKLLTQPISILNSEPIITARLRLSEFLGSLYKNVVYLDGDTQIYSDLKPLVKAPLGSRAFLACDDPMTFVLQDHTTRGEEMRRHMRAIGLTCGHRYFNAGVLRIDLDRWSVLADEALRRFRGARERPFRFQEQDILNMISGDQRGDLSLAWNFPAFFFNASIERTISPHIVHFTSHPKPWVGPFSPLGKAGYLPYVELIMRHPSLERFLHACRPSEIVRLKLHRNYTRLREYMTWRVGPRFERVIAYESREAGLFK